MQTGASSPSTGEILVRLLGILTSTHKDTASTSAAMLGAVLASAIKTQKRAGNPVDFRLINADKLHIVKNLSCYADGKTHCADPASGPYRCWANYESHQKPEEYGGVDQMSVIYDGLAWADTILFATSTRWGSHTALAQKIIERMNTLENRAVSYNEPYPMAGKKLGVIVGGLHWKSQSVALNLNDTFRWFKFDVLEKPLVWQYTSNVYYEQPASIRPAVEQWLLSPGGRSEVNKFWEQV